MKYEAIRTGHGLGVFSRALRATTDRSTVLLVFIGGADDLEAWFRRRQQQAS